jgi:hypothetical protein
MRWVLRRYSERVLQRQNFCSAICRPWCYRLSFIWELRSRYRRIDFWRLSPAKLKSLALISRHCAASFSSAECSDRS